MHSYPEQVLLQGISGKAGNPPLFAEEVLAVPGSLFWSHFPGCNIDMI